MAKVNDKTKVLEHLRKHGYITMRDAESIIPYGYLPSSIAMLRRDGHHILTDKKDMAGNPVKYVVYKLIESEEKDA